MKSITAPQHLVRHPAHVGCDDSHSNTEDQPAHDRPEGGYDCYSRRDDDPSQFATAELVGAKQEAGPARPQKWRSGDAVYARADRNRPDHSS